MNVPRITAFQFFVLALLFDQKRSGREIRDALLAFNERKNGPAFYQAMARLEDAGLVEGWYEQKSIHDQTVRERWYKITGDGVRAWQEADQFFVAVRRLPALRPGF